MYPCNESTDCKEAVLKGINCAALGKLVQEYVQALPPERLQAACHDQAVQALEAIYDVLENPQLDDPHALQKIEAISMEYFTRFGLRGSRHQEQD